MLSSKRRDKRDKIDYSISKFTEETEKKKNNFRSVEVRGRSQATSSFPSFYYIHAKKNLE